MKFTNEQFPNMAIQDDEGNVVVQFADGSFETDDKDLIDRLSGMGFVVADDAPKAKKSAK